MNLNPNKRGQVTLFIIIAIVIVALVVAFFLFRGNIQKENIPSQVEDIYLFVQDCIEGSGDHVIYEISKKGGYFFTPFLSTLEGVPYYFIDKEITILSKQKLEEELSKQMEISILLCTDGFQDFNESQINESDITVKSRLQEDSVIFEVNYPLSIEKKQDNFLLSDFGEFEFSSKLNNFYNSAEEIVYSFEQKNTFCLSCISDIALEKNIKVDIQNPYNSTFIFILTNQEEITGKTPIKFIFAIENEE